MNTININLCILFLVFINASRSLTVSWLGQSNQPTSPTSVVPFTSSAISLCPSSNLLVSTSIATISDPSACTTASFHTSDGTVLGCFTDVTAGTAVVATPTYTFIGDSSGGLTRFSTSSRTPSPFSGGAGPSGATLQVSSTPINGLAANAAGTVLFATSGSNVTVLKASSSSVTTVSSFSVDSAIGTTAGSIAFHDEASTLWVATSSSTTTTTTIAAFSPDGKPMPGSSITSVPVVAGLAVGAGRLYVGSASSSQVLVFNHTSLVATIGDVDGVLNGTTAAAGTSGPNRLMGVAGVAVSPDGTTVFIASAGYGGPAAPTGLDVRRFDMSTTNNDNNLVWSAFALEQSQAAFVDPDIFDQLDSGDLTVFSINHKYTLDLTQPPGKQASPFAYTINPKLFGGSDMRLHLGTAVSAPITQHVNGIKMLYLYSPTMFGGYMYGPGNAIQPYVLWGWDHKPGQFPTLAPSNCVWVWSDAGDCDGQMDPEEFHCLAPADPDVSAVSLDANGNLFAVSTSGQAYRFAFGWLKDTITCPSYSFNNTFGDTGGHGVKPFTALKGVHYDVFTDTMVLTGDVGTPDDAASGSDYLSGVVYESLDPETEVAAALAGSTGVVYTAWSQSPPSSKTDGAVHITLQPNTVATAVAKAVRPVSGMEDIVLFTGTSNGSLVVFNATDGSELASLAPPQSVGGPVQPITGRYAVSVYRQSNPSANEFVITSTGFANDVLVYQFTL